MKGKNKIKREIAQIPIQIIKERYQNHDLKKMIAFVYN